MWDKIKLATAVLLIAGGIFGFYQFADQALLYRVLGLLVVLGVAAAVALQTQPGAQAWDFARTAWVEVRKVVWPTRKETIQTTALVFVMVTIVGIMLWLFDMLLFEAVELLTRRGS